MSRAKLRKTMEYTLDVLKTCKEARTDDFRLIYEVCLKYNPSVSSLSYREIMTNHLAHNIPSYESVTRARRYWQKMFPELCEKVSANARLEEEAVHHENWSNG